MGGTLYFRVKYMYAHFSGIIYDITILLYYQMPDIKMTQCFRVEMRIADAVVRNPRLLKVGIKFEFKEAMNR